ncbi:methionine--tRNA ligase [bacterium]|nr:methionine--tRNA ligase [bacterium]
MNHKRILVTSALPYANGPLHIGQIAGAYLPADIYVRYQRLKGRNVIYICGSDEHGVPITVTADHENITPQDVVDRYHAMNRSSFEKLGIAFDHYSRTSIPLHHQKTQEFFLILEKKKDLVVKESEQFYSEVSHRFLPDRYVEGTCPFCGYDKARGDQCDRCGKWLESKELIDPRSKLDGSRPVLKPTKHWYLPMGRFAKAWKNWFDQHAWKENVRNYCIGWYKEGFTDRPITRDLHWGVPVPHQEAKGKVLYVWFDAPIGYISSTMEWAQKQGDPDLWKTYWCDPETKLVHFIGKDNIVFHAILFPMILMEVGGVVLPDAIPANEYLTIEGRKISTSQNYAIWLNDYLDRFPPDALRYTLAANAPETKDTDFSWKQLQRRNNDELADILGNFINRTLTFADRYFNRKVPERRSLDKLDNQMLKQIVVTRDQMGTCLEHFEVREGTKQLMDLCRFANKYFNDQAPWETRISDPERCQTTINICLQTIRALSVLMIPILPFTSEKVQRVLKLKDPNQWEDVGEKEFLSGHQLGRPEIFFEKIEDQVIENEIKAFLGMGAEGQKDMETGSKTISLETLKQIDLRTAKVLEAKKIEGTDKLLQLKIDLGDTTRQIVAGVAESYTPDQMIGKTLVVVANLQPAQIRGIESQGMLLAVQTEKGYTLLTTEDPVGPGLQVE